MNSRGRNSKLCSDVNYSRGGAKFHYQGSVQALLLTTARAALLGSAALEALLAERLVINNSRCPHPAARPLQVRLAKILCAHWQMAFEKMLGLALPALWS